MSKDESTVLKGVAILMMLFLHLFANPNVGEACTPWFYLGSLPLVTVLTRACNPVAFFIVLSGYGLSVVYAKGRLQMKSQLRRLLKLYVHYWLVLLIFVPLGAFLRPDRYPGDGWKMLLNATSYVTSYNAEHWFLFPYALLSLTAWPIFRLMDRLGKVRSLLVFFVVSLISTYFYSRYIAVNKLYDGVLGHALTYLSLLFSFVLGAAMFRLGEQRSLRVPFLESRMPLTVSLLLLLAAFRCVVNTAAIGSFYTILFVALFNQLSLWPWLRRFLLAMGRHSMVMWLIHTFFCYYLFHDFIYGFRFPLLIYAVLIAVSYVASFPVMWLGRKAVGLLRL